MTNVIMLVGGAVGGVGGFVYQAVAARLLQPGAYGGVASLIALYTVAMTPTSVLTLVIAHRAATLGVGEGTAGVRQLARSAGGSLILPCIAVIALGVLVAIPSAGFLRLRSPVPVGILGVVVAAGWLLAIPRGALQGLQRFTALSINLASEMVVRALSLVLILAAGWAISGAMAALVAGALFSLGLGVRSLRRLPQSTAAAPGLPPTGLSVSAAAAMVGVLMLFNLDVILARHYLTAHQAGIYASVNKTGTIIYFLTLGAAQVMFPKVVAAGGVISSQGRTLLQSTGLLCLPALVALGVFVAAPALVVRTLFGPDFIAAARVTPLAGLFGLAVSLVNLLAQFFVAIRDRWFLPLMVLGCTLELALIVSRHQSVTTILTGALIATCTLLLLLAGRSALLFRAGPGRRAAGTRQGPPPTG
jgi:O-antigen/teichoic acid export membrane protein